MPQETLYHAKLAKPRLPKVLRRERLFGLLDSFRQTPVIWLTGPPGCGKTTLVASYLERRRLSSLWYQIDERDRDPAAFFYYMGIGAQRGSLKTGKPLPVFTPEYVPGISIFTKRYFTELFNRLKNPSILVLDNCHEPEAEPQFPEILRDAVSVVPPWVNIFVLSRKPFPPPFARINASRSLAVVGWEDLRFTAEETRDLVGIMGYDTLGEEIVESIHRKTKGWAAGLILLLRDRGHTKAGSMTISSSSHEQVFDYFASEVFSHTDQDIRGFLMKTAFLPRMTPSMAEALTGRDGAEKILAELNRNHFFTEKHESGQTVYQYHALFRDFLLVRGQETIDSESFSRTQEQAAAILESEGFFEDAVSLYLDSGNVDQLARLIPSVASAVLAQGRNRTVEQWIDRIPLPFVHKSPWLLYWLGAARMPFNPKESVQLFEKAFSLFSTQQNVEGMAMALSGVLLAIAFSSDTFLPFNKWIPVAEEFRKTHFDSVSLLNRALITAGMLNALSLGQPDHESFTQWNEWGNRLLDQDIGFALKTQILIPLMSHRCFSGELSQFEHYLVLFRQFLKTHEAPPLSIISIGDMEAFYCWLKADFDSCRKACKNALDLAERTGIRVMRGFLPGNGAAEAMSNGELNRAQLLLKEMETHGAQAGAWEKGFYHTLRLWKALLEQDHSSAQFHASLALEYSKKAGMPQTVAIVSLGYALAIHEGRKEGRSSAILSKTLSACRRLKTYQTEFACLLAKAELAFDQGLDVSARESLAEAMALGQKWNYFNTFFWRPRVMCKLCVKALESGIKEKYVQNLIRRRELFPDEPPYDLDNWPWPVRIRTLGRFQLLVDGSPVDSGPKSPKRVLSLLKVIIAFGGHDVSEAQVSDGLWPDSDGDTAHRAFATTLHRLRKLVGRHEVIDLSEGRLSLNPRYVWVDVWAFENLVDRADAAWEKRTDAEGALNGVRLTERAIDLYKGAFLPGDSEETWTVLPRERLRSKYIRVVKRLCDYWKETGQIAKAVHCYHRCLETDELAEDLYHGLIACHQSAGQKAEALAVYERCREILAKVWGIEPSSDLQTLMRAILKNS